MRPRPWRPRWTGGLSGASQCASSGPNHEAQRVLPRATNRPSSGQCSRDSSKVSEGGRSIVPVSCTAEGLSPSRLLVRAEAASPTATLGASESGGWGGPAGVRGPREKPERESQLLLGGHHQRPCRQPTDTDPQEGRVCQRPESRLCAAHQKVLCGFPLVTSAGLI